LLGFALDQGVPDAIALQAVRDALDRAGLSPKTAVEVDVAVKPFEQILTNRIEGGSRAEWRRSKGIADEPPTALAEAPCALDAADDGIVDAELIDPLDDQHMFVEPGGMTPESDDWQPDEHTAAGIDPLADADNPFGRWSALHGPR
jgi:hypothetical protein